MSRLAELTARVGRGSVLVTAQGEPSGDSWQVEVDFSPHAEYAAVSARFRCVVAGPGLEETCTTALRLVNEFEADLKG